MDDIGHLKAPSLKGSAHEYGDHQDSRSAEVLTNLPQRAKFVGMRANIHIDDDLLEQAAKLTGIEEKTALVRLGLQTLVAKESARPPVQPQAPEKSPKVPNRSRRRSLKNR